jgi:hypothetical protein
MLHTSKLLPYFSHFPSHILTLSRVRYTFPLNFHFYLQFTSLPSTINGLVTNWHFSLHTLPMLKNIPALITTMFTAVIFKQFLWPINVYTATRSLRCWRPWLASKWVAAQWSWGVRGECQQARSLLSRACPFTLRNEPPKHKAITTLTVQANDGFNIYLELLPDYTRTRSHCYHVSCLPAQNQSTL